MKVSIYMLDLELCINGQEIALGETLNRKINKDADLKRPGLLMRLTSRNKSDKPNLWAKNPVITCFNGEFKLSPRLRAPDPDLINGTSTFLYMEDNIERITLSCIKSAIASEYYAEIFLEICREKFGEPDSIGLIIVWRDHDSAILVDGGWEGVNLFIHWITGAWLNKYIT